MPEALPQAAHLVPAAPTGNSGLRIARAESAVVFEDGGQTTTPLRRSFHVTTPRGLQ
jgi:hypothetical protein